MTAEKTPLCSCCGTGLQELALDKHAPHCPFLFCHNGTECPLFSPLKEPLQNQQRQQNKSP